MQEYLAHIRSEASQNRQYDSKKTREDLSHLVQQRCEGKVPYQWQLDTAEALLLGIDTIVIAGTGAGKTLPFVMPILKDPSKMIIIISPLKALQRDQRNRFRKMKISAIDINGDTWNRRIRQALKSNRYQAILVGPEMCLKHEEFRHLLRTPEFTKNLAAVIIDEAHCISQWGGDFRPAYNQLSDLRSFVPSGVPFLATTATLTPAALREVQLKLHISATKSFFVNLGNDRPNITAQVRPIKNSKDYSALLALIGTAITAPEDLEKTIIFVDSLQKTLEIERYLREHLPASCYDAIDILHAIRSPRSKSRILAWFRAGKVRVLVATEAAGMGTDIPDITHVIQFGVPSSLEVWTQRAGRAGRSPSISARATLLVEESMFQQQKRAKKKRKVKEWREGSPGSESEPDVLEVEGEAVLGWKKEVDPTLRAWIETPDCRRVFLDKYFDNPIARQSPIGDCCDRCVERKVSLGTMPYTGSTSTNGRPQTPIGTQPPSSHTTPTKSPKVNRKRPMESNRSGLLASQLKTENDLDDTTLTPKRTGPAVRRGDQLKNARKALLEWRSDVKRTRYSPSSFTADAILPKSILTTLASNARIHTLSDLAAALKRPWMLQDKHGEEVIKVLQAADEKYLQTVQDSRKALHEARKAVRGDANEEIVPAQTTVGEPLVRSVQFNITAQTTCKSTNGASSSVSPSVPIPSFTPSHPHVPTPSYQPALMSMAPHAVLMHPAGVPVTAPSPGQFSVPPHPSFHPLVTPWPILSYSPYPNPIHGYPGYMAVSHSILGPPGPAPNLMPHSQVPAGWCYTTLSKPSTTPTASSDIPPLSPPHASVEISDPRSNSQEHL